jgi:transposase-like protein
MELEHAPTGIRIIVPRLSTLPLEDAHRLSQLPGVLRAAAEFIDPPRRGPRRGSVYGGGGLRFRIVEIWLRTGKPPTQAAVAEDLDIDASALSRAVRGSGYSIRGSARKAQGSGWDDQLAVAAMFIRRQQMELPAPEPDELTALARKRRLLNGVDLTGF